MRLKKPFFSTFYFTSVAILFLCSLSLNAQTDSLQGKSYEELVTLFDATIREDASESRSYATKAYQLAKQENDLEKMMRAKYNIARSNYAMAEYTTSIKNLDEVIHIATGLKNNLLLFRSYNLKGNNLCELNKNNEAFDEYLEAREYAKLTKNPIHISSVAINIVLIKKIHKDYQECIDILLENLQLLKNLDDPSEEKIYNERIILLQLADTYLRIKQPQKAEDYNKLALAITPKEEFPNTYYFILMNDAIIQYQIKNHQQSIDICREIEGYYISTNETSRLMTPYQYIGKNYYELKEFPKATNYLEKTIAISDQFKLDFSERKEIYHFLQLSHTQIGNKEKASEYSIKQYELDEKNDSLDISLNNRINKEHDIIPLQEEITSLGDDNQKQKKRAKYLYAILGVLGITLIGFFIWFKQKQKLNKKRFQELLVTIKKLEQPKEKTMLEVIATESSNPITDENALQILKDLGKFEEKKLYLRQDCTLGYVAKKLKTNTSYLSNVINTYKEKSFKTYLSELRINAALIQLKNDSKLRSYTIKAIAEEFGFKRSETFSRAFKSQTDMYPSHYIKRLENQKDT
ncbi:AraC family transcriptional regulator [Kordia sp. YSTF-M3]|uniref:AraC family transcriptional regulator n=1 Tax=Kordia aestuariivivens TaxID=2759037 RepID=A0ABR7QGG5_9FLAO|nr:AraC family transcriptional regulator [Kordia aestuariivivens]MBC8757603.1 AraC family transcriptional regulator [Kordia aestuariivivens]